MDEEEAKINSLIHASGGYEEQIKLIDGKLQMLKAEAQGYKDLAMQSTPYIEGLNKQIDILEKQRKTLIKGTGALTKFKAA